MGNESGYGYVDDNSDEFKSKVGGKFGLNQGATVLKLEFSETAGKDNAPGNAVIFEVQIGDKVFKTRIYEVTRVYVNNELLDPEAEGYKEALDKKVRENFAVITHIVKGVGVTDAALKQAFKTPATTQVDWMSRTLALIPDTLPKVDIFLEFQWNIAEGATRTFLQLPKNMKGGRWICEALPGKFKEVREIEDPDNPQNGERLYYINDKDKKHPFERPASFMTDKKANMQTVNEENNGEASSQNKVQDAKGSKTTW